LKIYLDNIIFSLQSAGGVSTYWYELWKELLKDKDQYVIALEQCQNNKNMLRKMLDIQPKMILSEAKTKINLIRYIPIQKKIVVQSIFHSSYYRYSKQKDIVQIVTIHDFTYEYYRSGVSKLIHSWQKGNAIRQADGLICVSNNTRNDLLKFYPQLNPDKVRVIYNGVSNDFYPINDCNDKTLEQVINNPYYLFIGDRSKYKNFDIAVELAQTFVDKHLVIVGSKQLNERELGNLNTKLKNRWHFICNVSQGQLNTLYNFAFCLLYLSEYEGFGIPVIEAMGAGCPVVALNRSSIPEVAGSAAILCDNTNISDLYDKVKVLDNPKVRAEIITKGFAQAKIFSWEKCYQETIAFYKTIYDRKFG